MNPDKATRRSKFLAMVLRHRPERAGIHLDEAGWVSINELIYGCTRAGHPLTREQLNHIVETNTKKRFEFSRDGEHIRASQGHSVEVDLRYEPQSPPETLYHGTASRFLDSIRTQGLAKMQRHHVHLSSETRMTLEVGARRGKPVLLTIRAGDMYRAGHAFYLSTNGVWLADHIPPEFILFPEDVAAKLSPRGK